MKQKWIKLIERKGDFLKTYLLYENYIDNFPKVFNIKMCDFLTSRKNNTFIHYIDPKGESRISNFLVSKLKKDPLFLTKSLRKAKIQFNKLLSFCKQVSSLNLSSLDNKNLKDLAEKYFKLYKAPYPYGNITLFGKHLTKNPQAIKTLSKLRYIARINFDKAHDLISPLFTEIAKKNNTSKNKIKFLSPSEITAVLKGKEININKIIKTRKNCVFILSHQKFVVKEDSKFSIKEKFPTKIKGIGTFPALYTSTVRIIKSKQDISKAKKGEILVLKNAGIDLVTAAIKKAGAIITDEGGMTSHAASLSRELNIPALIGTKVATKLLKTKDIVEIDTKKGIAKIQPTPLHKGLR